MSQQKEEQDSNYYNNHANTQDDKEGPATKNLPAATTKITTATGAPKFRKRTRPSGAKSRRKVRNSFDAPTGATEVVKESGDDNVDNDDDNNNNKGNEETKQNRDIDTTPDDIDDIRKRYEPSVISATTKRRRVAEMTLLPALKSREKSTTETATATEHDDDHAATTMTMKTPENNTTESSSFSALVRKKKPKPFGPIRSAPAHLRVSVRMDYQPDVCKDYKETGYCGFGDACKFLHDRSDYKAGWKSGGDGGGGIGGNNSKKKNSDNNTEDENNNDDDGLPFACFLCREDFKQPVMTLCQHYFCQQCALDRMSNGQGNCPICGKQMRGTLNVASKLVAKLERMRKVVGGDDER